MRSIERLRQQLRELDGKDYGAYQALKGRWAFPEFDLLIGLEEFESQTGCAVLVNTSFNVRGEPIVCSPQDAYRCFMRTEMDLLVLEDCLLFKEEQPAQEADESWRDEYALD